MTRGRFGWPLTCPKCRLNPKTYYGVLKVPNEKVNLQCPNCNTRLVDAARYLSADVKAARSGE